MNHYMKKHHAFTLLEMVFVITILGIVAAISSEVIAKSYESYINQRALHRASVKTELVATQIANRLAYAMPGSIVARNDNDINFNALVGIKDLLPNNNFRVLQWIGYDRDGFTSRDAGALGANRRPVWSGFADLSATARVPGNNVNVSTPGSNLNLATGNGMVGNGIIPNLSTIGVARNLAGSALYTPVEGLAMYNAGVVGNYTPVGTQGIYSINGQIAGNAQAFQITMQAAAGNTIAEQYKLAWTSYAIVPTPVVNGTFDLFLHFNFQPWNGDNYRAIVNGGQAQRRLLLTNVTVFRFTGSDNALRFKLCQRERIGGTLASPTFITICKEKVVIK